MSRIAWVLIAIATVGTGTIAAAQEGVPAAKVEQGGEDAFDLVPAEGRHLKIDRRTGSVSICEEKSGEWQCQLVADDRAVYEVEVKQLRADLDRLQKRNDELEKKVAQLENGRDWLGPDDEEKLDRFMDFTDKAFRRFFGMVESLKKDYEQSDALKL